MPASQRRVTPDDIIPDADFRTQRAQRRAALMPRKTLRRIDVGPYCTAYFETFDTMLFQIQEMLMIEKGGPAQLVDEMAAYNPLIPQGGELVATVMFEIDDPLRRANILARLGGVEDHFFLQVGDARSPGQQEGDIERTREDGKTSAIHFLRFALTPEQAAAFRDPKIQVMLGVAHPVYDHRAVLSEATRAELATDLD